MSMASMSGMEMPMASTTSMVSATGTSMSAATSASTMNMHSMGSGGLMGMQDMAMVFFTSTMTPLYGYSWSPNSVGTYAGTCIFLIFLSIFLRILFAVKMILEQKWMDRTMRRRYIEVVDPEVEAMFGKEASKSATATLTSNGLVERVKIIHRASPMSGRSWSKPWRLSVDLPRALLTTVMVGVGYLLMLAVMTMNVGYFLSVLGGAFLGELLFGRFSTHVGDHH